MRSGNRHTLLLVVTSAYNVLTVSKGWSCNSIGDASYDVCLSLQNGRSPLMVAASRGRVKCLQLLLDKGADVNHQDEVSSFHHEMRSLLLVHVYHISFSYMNGIQYSISLKSTLSEKNRSFLKAHIFLITITSTRIFHMYGYHFISRHTCTEQICADICCYGVVHCDVPKVSV